MSPERDQTADDDEVREFRLEGLALVIVGVVLLVVLVGVFQLGRWWEARSLTEAGRLLDITGEPIRGSGGAGATDTKVVSAEEGLTVFDTAAGEQKELEPGREARPAAVTPEPAPVAGAARRDYDPSRTAVDPEGAFFVQVFAGRERRSAEKLVSQLSDRGYPVRLDSIRDGGDLLFKVRVGGYASRDAAEPVVSKLKKEGFSGAFIATLD